MTGIGGNSLRPLLRSPLLPLGRPALIFFRNKKMQRGLQPAGPTHFFLENKKKRTLWLEIETDARGWNDATNHQGY